MHELCSFAKQTLDFGKSNTQTSLLLSRAPVKIPLLQPTIQCSRGLWRNSQTVEYYCIVHNGAGVGGDHSGGGGLGTLEEVTSSEATDPKLGLAEVICL